MKTLIDRLGGATALVRQGRLDEATAAIRRTLSGGAPDEAPQARAQDEAPQDDATQDDARPMRDVTPRPAALPSPGRAAAGDGAEGVGTRAASEAASKTTAEAAPEAAARRAAPSAGAPTDAAPPERAQAAAAPRGRWPGGDAGARSHPRIDLSALDALKDRLPGLGGLSGGGLSGGGLPSGGFPGGLAGFSAPRPASPLPGQRGGARAPLPEGARFEERQHRGPHGAMGYKLYIPANAIEAPPLIVMLHGCTQDPDDFAAGTRMNELAEAAGAIVAYPRQESARNPNRCWSWFEPAHQGRSGEAAMIAAVAGEVIAEHGCDPSRVLVAGLSAGGAMAAALGASYPEVFGAVGIHSGLPAGAASDMPGAFAAMGGRGGGARPIPARVIAFHGTQDRTVAPVNAERIATAGRAATGAAKPRLKRGEAGGRGYERTRLAPEGRAGAVELWRVEGLGHAWSGGSAAGSYADPAGPDASREMLRFLMEA